eukprot:gene9944-biopygen7725
MPAGKSGRKYPIAAPQAPQGSKWGKYEENCGAAGAAPEEKKGNAKSPALCTSHSVNILICRVCVKLNRFVWTFVRFNLIWLGLVWWCAAPPPPPPRRQQQATVGSGNGGWWRAAAAGGGERRRAVAAVVSGRGQQQRRRAAAGGGATTSVHHCATQYKPYSNLAPLC